MALHEYTTELLGNKSAIRILKTLLRYKGKIFTIRELARTAELSHPEASKVVKKLEKRGVLKIQFVGKAHQVSLNEDSYALKSIIEPAFEAEENTPRALVSTIRPFFKDKRIYSVAIFGSVAKSLEKESSDIDLLVITNDEEFANSCASRANSETISKFGFAISPLIMSKEHFIRIRHSDLEKSILESYTIVSGRDLSEFVQNVKTSR